STRSDAGDGCIVSGTSVGRRIWRNPADLHRSGLEHGVQFLCFSEKHSERNARSSPDLRIQLVAAIHRDGIALCGHRPGLELDDVGSGWVVLPDGLRDVCAWLT